jgi:hypothetical protein
MMGIASRLASALLGVIATAGVAQAHEPDGPKFVAAFRQACVPGRLSYSSAREHLASIGWKEVEQDVDQDLSKLLQKADKAVLEEAGKDWSYRRTAFGGFIDGKPHFVVVTRVHAPEIITLIGCNLYDFGATSPIDPQPVSDFLGAPPAETIDEKGMTGFTWGPSPKLPGTLDTNLFFITKGSPMRDASGFAGVLLKFETSEPDGAE